MGDDGQYYGASTMQVLLGLKVYKRFTPPSGRVMRRYEYRLTEIGMLAALWLEHENKSVITAEIVN